MRAKYSAKERSNNTDELSALEMGQVVLSMTRNCSHSLRLNNLQRNENDNV